MEFDLNKDSTDDKIVVICTTPYCNELFYLANNRISYPNTAAIIVKCPKCKQVYRLNNTQPLKRDIEKLGF
ncbi:MAG: hypothetical protein Q4P17_04020 [Methanobacterium sp.]|nr:hypothetical protein [Methanobacterium sp.]